MKGDNCLALKRCQIVATVVACVPSSVNLYSKQTEISCPGDRWEIMVGVCGCKPCLHVDLKMEDPGVLYMMKNGFLVGLQ